MGQYDGKILLSDMDGTLLNSESRVSEKNKQAIHDFIKGGGKFGIATGRILRNAAAFLEGVEINGYCILANGSLLYDSEKKEYPEEIGIDQNGIREFLQRCLRERKAIDIQVYARDLSYFISPKELADPDVVQDHIPVGFESMEQLKDVPWLKILFAGEPEDIEWLQKESEYLEQAGVVNRVRSAERYYEFLPEGSSKGGMLKRLRKYLPEDAVVYAVGDFYNDEEMFEAADVGIAVSNAPDSVKEHADRICRSCDESAIADIIENIIR